MRLNLLYDFYGELLTDKKKTIMQSYYEDDLSLAEIAENLNISRQAVLDAVKTTGKSLENYESKLHLVEKFQDRNKMILELDETLTYLEELMKSTEAINIEKRKKAVETLTRSKSLLEKINS